MVKVMGEVLHAEIAAICSDDFKSVMMVKSKSSVRSVDEVMKSIHTEMKAKTPMLLSLLNSCLRTRRSRSNTDTLLVVIVSIICKHRRPSACIIQRIVSLILYSGHSTKQVRINLLQQSPCMVVATNNIIRFFSGCRS